MTVISDLVLRRAGDDDLDAIVDLAGEALGWVPTEPNDAWFRWKHLDNPFGASPMWVAENHDGRLVGFRTFLRWELVRGETTLRVARAVDTATAPGAQGRGIFSQLTELGLEDLAADGTRFVFNTPNAKSRPGYLKMGWEILGRPRTSVRVRSVGAARRLAGARVAAEKFSLPTDVGDPAREVFGPNGDAGRVEALIKSSREPGRRLTTNRSVAYLAWRYGFGPLRYRVAVGPDGIEGGAVVFRLRRRGQATEVVVDEVLTPVGAGGAARRLLGRVLKDSRADYLLRVDRSRVSAGGFVVLPGQGPLLTWRGVTDWNAPSLDAWDLTLGDVELM